jgi:hypothetical protein
MLPSGVLCSVSQVTIRVCTGDASKPIIVDVNNLQQQIYVYGQMHWEGNIKFINSFPSQRRAGLFPLISILSVEHDGIIAFEVGAVKSCTAFTAAALPCLQLHLKAAVLPSRCVLRVQLCCSEMYVRPSDAKSVHAQRLLRFVLASGVHDVVAQRTPDGLWQVEQPHTDSVHFESAHDGAVILFLNLLTLSLLKLLSLSPIVIHFPLLK